ncbi:hypothetical protein RCL1_007149 [Eukaryota sp. TZLM3-RCL]
MIKQNGLYYQLNISAMGRLVSLDMSNAFNCLSRQAIFDSVSVHFPHWLPFLSWSYGSPSNLFYINSVILSSEGVKQGDPLGPFLYSLVTSKILAKVRQVPGLKAISYLDDGVKKEGHATQVRE